MVYNLCSTIRDKDAPILDVIWLIAIEKALKRGDSSVLKLTSLSQFTLIIYFENIRNKTLHSHTQDYVYKKVQELIEKVSYTVIHDFSKINNKNVFIHMKSHAEYHSTIEKISQYIEKHVIWKYENYQDFIIYKYLSLNRELTIKTKDIFLESVDCMQFFLNNKWNDQAKNNESPKSAKSSLYKKDERMGIPIAEHFNKESNLTNIKSYIPTNYQLTKYKEMPTKELFEHYENFLFERNEVHPTSYLSQFYFYLKKNYKNQSYNRTRLVSFINDYYHKDYQYILNDINVEKSPVNYFFNRLDKINENFGFNILETLINKDINYFLRIVSNIKNLHYDYDINEKNDFVFLNGFRGIEYKNSHSNERYKMYKDNFIATKNIEKYTQELEQIYNDIYKKYKSENIIRYFEITNQLLELNNLNNYIESKSFDSFKNAPYTIIKLIDALNNLNSLTFDFNQALVNKKINLRGINILYDRLKGVTLDAIGFKHGLTRERIRQIEKKVKRKINHNSFKHIVDKTNTRIKLFIDNDFYISVTDLEMILENDFQLFVYLNEIHNKNFYYNKKFNFVSFQSIYINKIIEFIKSFNPIISEEELNQKLESITSIHSFVKKESLRNIIDHYYKKSYDFIYSKEKFSSKPERVKLILKLYYLDGIKVYNDEEINNFKDYYFKIFERNDFSNQSTRTIGSYITHYTDIVDRGTYALTSKKTSINYDVVHRIESLISKLGLIYIETLFIWIKNEFPLKEIKSVEEFSRLIKPHIHFPNNRFYYANTKEKLDYQYYLIDYLKSKNGVHHAREIEKRFQGINKKTILNIYNQSDEIISLRNSRYIHVANVGLNNDELNRLKIIIDKVLEQLDYIHIFKIYEKAIFDDEISMNEEVLNDSLGLYNVVKFHFANHYNFSRPIIAKKETYIDTYNNMLNHYFFSKDIVKISDLRAFAESLHQPNSIHEILDMYFPQYYLINADEFMLRDSLGINKLVAESMERILKHFMQNNPYLGIDKFNLWDVLPKIGVDWTPQLIYSTARDYFKNVEFIFSNKSYRYMKYRIEWRS